MPASQSFENHTKFDPLFHYTLLPIHLILILWAIGLMGLHPNSQHAWMILAGIALLLITGKTRIYALHNQDRIIRLEERLRLQRLMPHEPTLVDSITPDQLVGLRFACDQELPALAKRAVLESLTRKQIKQAISVWREDKMRC